MISSKYVCSSSSVDESLDVWDTASACLVNAACSYWVTASFYQNQRGFRNKHASSFGRMRDQKDRERDPLSAVSLHTWGGGEIRGFD